MKHIFYQVKIVRWDKACYKDKNLLRTVNMTEPKQIINLLLRLRQT